MTISELKNRLNLCRILGTLPEAEPYIFRVPDGTRPYLDQSRISASTLSYQRARTGIFIIKHPLLAHREACSEKELISLAAEIPLFIEKPSNKEATLQFYPKTPASLYSLGDLIKGYHWLGADIICVRCRKEQEFAACGGMDGKCIRCKNPFNSKIEVLVSHDYNVLL